MNDRIGMRAAWSVIRKELVSYTGGATIYIVAIVFLLLWEYLFFRNVFLVGEASLSGLFQYLPWLLLILVPALTMGSVSAEKTEGTLELLLTHPLRDRELIAGKFLAATFVGAVLLAFSLVVGATFEPYGNLDWGIVAGQYFASLGLVAVLVALGIFVSSVLASQVSSLLVTAAASFFLIVAGFDLVTARLPLSVAAFLEQLSVLTHFTSMSRGVIDIRDVWYFISVVAVFLTLAYLMLLRRRFGARRDLYFRYQAGVAMLIGMVVLTNIIGARIPGRIDLTQGNLYTLSSTTRDVVTGLEDVVNVTLYTSAELPAQQQPLLRDVRDMLRDYQTIGTGKIVLRFKNTSSSKKVAEEAATKGVQEMQFNVVGDEELKVKKGFFGIAVTHSGKSKAIPYVESTNDLEYQLTSLISELTVDKKPKAGFLTGHGEKNPDEVYQTFKRELERQFDISTVKVDYSTGSMPKDLDVLVVAGPNKKARQTDSDAIREFIDKGKSVLFMIDRVTVITDAGFATPNQNSMADIVQQYGVEVGNSLVYDLNSNVTVPFGSGGGLSFMVNYALWPRALASRTQPASRGLQDVSLSWASPVIPSEAGLGDHGLKSHKLLTTSEAGGLDEEPFDLNPQQQFSQEGLSTKTLAISIEPLNPTSGKKGPVGDEPQPGRMIVVGDSDLFTDDMLQRSPANLAFGMQSMSWLGQEASLASIKVRNTVPKELKFEEKSTASRVKWENLIVAFLVPALFGGVRLWTRRRLSAWTFSQRRRYKLRKKTRRPA